MLYRWYHHCPEYIPQHWQIYRHHSHPHLFGGYQPLERNLILPTLSIVLRLFVCGDSFGQNTVVFSVTIRLDPPRKPWEWYNLDYHWSQWLLLLLW